MSCHVLPSTGVLVTFVETGFLFMASLLRLASYLWRHGFFVETGFLLMAYNTMYT